MCGTHRHRYFVCYSINADNRLTLANKVLIDSSKRGDVKRFAEAHQNGGDLQKVDADGMTVLHNAARFNCKDVCQYIIQHAPVNFLDTIDKEKYVSFLSLVTLYCHDAFVRSCLLYSLSSTPGHTLCSIIHL